MHLLGNKFTLGTDNDTNTQIDFHEVHEGLVS